MPRLPHVILALAVATTASAVVPDADLALDDECIAQSGNDCALSALQHKARRTQGVQQPEDTTQEAEGSDDAAAYDAMAAATGGKSGNGSDCKDCMSNNFAPGSQDLGSSPIWHYAQNCWWHCGQKAGSCSWCGPGNSCCRYRSTIDPPECQGTRFWPVLSFHTCVQGHRPPASNPAAPVAPGTGYHPAVAALLQPSAAPTYTFYMYRSADDSDYPLENVNAANLAGAMWYLHNEVVIQTPRKFGITRIIRVKVQTKAPAPLIAKGMNFGVRYAFDSGECTGPWSCDDQFAKYGYFVGCNYVSDFPTAKWGPENHYKDAIWYSLPGPCSSKTWSAHDATCILTQPGGLCAGSPTGTGDCTYSYEMAGEIRIDELEGIADYKSFVGLGGKEYDKHTDTGVNMDFWAGKHDDAKCAARVAAAEKLFAQKYGASSLPNPPCDFNYNSFYR